jgi:hypothetical protein
MDKKTRLCVLILSGVCNAIANASTPPPATAPAATPKPTALATTPAPTAQEDTILQHISQHADKAADWGQSQAEKGRAWTLALYSKYEKNIADLFSIESFNLKEGMAKTSQQWTQWRQSTPSYKQDILTGIAQTDAWIQGQSHSLKENVHQSIDHWFDDDNNKDAKKDK